MSIPIYLSGIYKVKIPPYGISPIVLMVKMQVLPLVFAVLLPSIVTVDDKSPAGSMLVSGISEHLNTGSKSLSPVITSIFYVFREPANFKEDISIFKEVEITAGFLRLIFIVSFESNETPFSYTTSAP